MNLWWQLYRHSDIGYDKNIVNLLFEMLVTCFFLSYKSETHMIGSWIFRNDLVWFVHTFGSYFTRNSIVFGSFLFIFDFWMHFRKKCKQRIFFAKFTILDINIIDLNLIDQFFPTFSINLSYQVKVYVIIKLRIRKSNFEARNKKWRENIILDLKIWSNSV